MSDRARQAAKIYYENLGKISKGKAMIQAGFTVATSKTPQIATVQQDWQSVEMEFIDRLDLEVDAVLEEAQGKRYKAGYADCISAAEKLVKLKQLLTGGATSRDDGTINIINYGNNNSLQVPTKKLSDTVTSSD